MRWCKFIILISLTAIVGCGLFPKNESGSNPGSSGDRMPPPAAPALNTSRNGVLAGQVVDTFNQRRAGVNLNLQPIDGGDSVSAITNDQGYFTVTNLQSGKRYRILAKTQNSGTQSTGSTEATAPNVVVLIKLNDSRTETDGKSMGMSGSVGGRHSSIAGPDDTAPAWSRGNPAATGRGDRLGAAPDVIQPTGTNGNGAGASPTVNPRLGRPVTSDPSPSASTAPVRPEYITQAEPRVTPPLMDIRGPGTNTPGEPARASTGGAGYFDLPLLDLDGRPTTLATYRGRLTLVDCWNTDCIPCLQAMPELMKVQRSYKSLGLVVVGIAINERGRAEDNADKIRWRTGQKGIDYPLLMEQPGRSASQAFKVEQVPTLILLDETGKEVWRNVGFNPDTRRALEQELQKRLR